MILFKILEIMDLEASQSFNKTLMLIVLIAQCGTEFFCRMTAETCCGDPIASITGEMAT